VAENRAHCTALVGGAHLAVMALYAEPVEVTAELVAPFFPDLPPEILIRAIAGYRASGLWARSPALPAPTVVALKAALLSGGLIQRDIPYEAIVDDTVWQE